MSEAGIIDWARGDAFGIDLPAHVEALKAGGAEFLTSAFRASGRLAEDGKVIGIKRCDEWDVGGTGAKALLSVEYDDESSTLARDFFVKFSRSFTDRARDSVRYSMEPEVRLANLSCDPAFPVAVPKCAYADFNHLSGTGIIITERIPYGQGRSEPHHLKCMDHILPDPLAHYRILISTLARLSGTHRSGSLGEAAERDFPLDLQALLARRNRYDKEQLARRADRMRAFIARYPHLVPSHLADPAFLDRFRADAPLFIGQQEAIRRFHLSRPEMIALCHWNANIDNAWFWREADGALRCGLIDWGNVGQMHVGRTIWGSICGSEPEFVDTHLDELLDLFIADYVEAGGPAIGRVELGLHFDLQVMISGLGWMMNAPAFILSDVPDLHAVADRYDPIFAINETARVQLKVMISFLNIWHRRDLGRFLRAK